jgi:hypothetical protein
MRYEITLNGPNGESIPRTLAGGENRLTIRVLPGIWNIGVRAYVDTPDTTVNAVLTAGQLRGMVTKSVTVLSGQTAPVEIKLQTVTGVKTWAQLLAALQNADDGDYVIVEENIEYDGGVGSIVISHGNKVTLLADGEKEISAPAGHDYFFALDSSSVGNSTLVLGDPAALAQEKLTISGSSDPSNYSLIRINDPGSTLEMNDNVFLVNNETSTNTVAGAVQIDDGTFVMNGGTISGNTAGGFGGGVFVDSGGEFTMQGGSITGNSAGAGGGGIGAEDGGNFTMKGGSVTGNSVTPGGSGTNLHDNGSPGFSPIRWEGGAIDDAAPDGSGIGRNSMKFLGWNTNDSDWSGTYSASGPPEPADEVLFPMWEGDGSSPTAPILINDLAGLANIGVLVTNLGLHYYLTDDITITGTWTALGDDTTPFTGSLNGNGHTITFDTGVTITPLSPSANEYVGIIGYMDDDPTPLAPPAEVRNLIVNGPITYTSTISSLNDLAVGGIVGHNAGSGSIYNCGVKSEITIEINTTTSGSIYVGGIVGQAGDTAHSNKIYRCSYTGTLIWVHTIATSFIVSVGGIAGEVTGSGSPLLSACYSTGNIKHDGLGATTTSALGGIAGRAIIDGKIDTCYALGEINDASNATNYYTGGVVGEINTNDAVSNCVALNGDITTPGSPSDYGRVAGFAGALTVTSNFGLETMKMNSASVFWSHDVSGKNGDQVTATQAATQTWWTDTAVWGIGSDASTWRWDSGNNRPILYWE